jgi:hypothetical protein
VLSVLSEVTLLDAASALSEAALLLDLVVLCVLSVPVFGRMLMMPVAQQTRINRQWVIVTWKWQEIQRRTKLLVLAGWQQVSDLSLRSHLTLFADSCTFASMIHTHPLIFFKSTPINSTGTTVVDLGEMDESFEGPRYSSLPPVTTPVTETRWQMDNARGGRHRSLPPKMVKIKRAPPVSVGEDPETDGETDDTDSVLSRETVPSPRKGNNHPKVSC